VTVRVSGTAGVELTVEVANPVVVGAGATVDSAADIPGAQSGLIGLRERVDLAGGTFSCGVGPVDRFVVVARLPWPA
jgi:signal transduction histidine kinase